MMHRKYLILTLSIVIIFCLLLFKVVTVFFSGKKVEKSFSGSANVFRTSSQTQGLKDFAYLYNHGNFKDLNTQLDLSIRSNPVNFDLLLQKANVLAQEASLTFKEKELGDKAMFYVDRALAIVPTSTKALTIKGYIYEIQGDYQNSHKYYDEALRLDPSDYAILAQKAHAYLLEGEVDKAEEYFSKSIGVNPSNAEALFGMAKIKVGKAEITEAVSLLEKASTYTENYRKKAEIYYSISAILSIQKKQDSKEIEKYSYLALETDKTYAQAYLAVAKVSLNKYLISKDSRDLQGSFNMLDKALKLNPNLTISNIQLYIQLMAINKKEEALFVLQKTKEIIPKDISLSSSEKKQMEKFVVGLSKDLNKNI